MKGLSIDRRRRMRTDDRGQAGGGSTSPGETNLAEARRYTDAANIENHPQVSDFVPRRFRSYLTLATVTSALGGTFVAIGLQAGAGTAPAARALLETAGRLQHWMLSLMLGVASSVLAVLVYSLRRHRVDDYRARYRVWLWVAIGAAGASANAVAGLLGPAAEMLTAASGWAPLSNPAIWWVLPLGLVGAWLSFRLAADLRECRFAITALVFGAALFAVSLAQAVGWRLVPAQWHAASVSLVSLGSAALFTLALMLYARFVVLDVQGLIAHAEVALAAQTPAKERPSAAGEQSASAKRRRSRAQDDSVSTPSPATFAQPKAAQQQPTEWVDGSCPEEDEYGDDAAPRKLSKSERKQLRKQRLRRAA